TSGPAGLSGRSTSRCFSIASSPRGEPGWMSTSTPWRPPPRPAGPRAAEARAAPRASPLCRRPAANGRAAPPRNAALTPPAPARPDLAASDLRGKVAAARFVDGETREVRDENAPLRRAPAPDAPLDTEALKGEYVTVYETTEEGWCWGQLARDGYVGWLP